LRVAWLTRSRRPQEVDAMQYLLLLIYRPEDNTQEGTPEFEAKMRC
jgi:hypothetical protein